MACPDGECQDHNMTADRVPDGNDCPGSDLGNFCQGSFWYFVDAANPDCPNRLFMRIGDACGVNQWIELPIPSRLTGQALPPVNGVDCCPLGSSWTIPAGTNGSLVDQVWISTGDCNWCQICGFEPVEIRMSEPNNNPANVIPPGVRTGMFFDEIVTDPLNEVTLAGQATTWIPIRTGWYTVRGSVLMDLPTPGTSGNILLFNIARGGVIDVTKDLSTYVQGVLTTGEVRGGLFQTNSNSVNMFFTAGEVITFEMIQLAWPGDVFMRGPDTWVQIQYNG